MAALRERQKRERREAIFEAAATLFGERGYTATSMEEIAAQAGVSVPTVYAYFPAKADLMVAIYAADRALVEAEKEALIAAPPADPAEAITALLLIEMRNGLDYLDNRVWRELVASSIRSQGDFQAGLDSLNERAFDQPVTRLFEVLAARGDLAADLRTGAAVALLSDLSMAVFHQQITGDLPWQWVERRVRDGVTIAVRGMLAQSPPASARTTMPRPRTGDGRTTSTEQ